MLLPYPVLLVHDQAIVVQIKSPSKSEADLQAKVFAQNFPGTPLNSDSWHVSTPTKALDYKSWLDLTSPYPKAEDSPQWHVVGPLVPWSRVLGTSGNTYSHTITDETRCLWYYLASSSQDAQSQAQAEWIEGGVNEPGRVNPDGTVSHTARRWVALMAGFVDRTVYVR
jgi:hypothetical protein